MAIKRSVHNCDSVLLSFTLFIFSACIDTQNKMTTRSKNHFFGPTPSVEPSRLNSNLNSNFGYQGLVKDSNFSNSSLLSTEGHQILNAQGRLYVVGLEHTAPNLGSIKVWPVLQDGKVDASFINSGSSFQLPVEGCRKLTSIGLDKKLVQQTQTYNSIQLPTLRDGFRSIESVMALGSSGYVLSQYQKGTNQYQWLLQRFNLNTGGYDSGVDCLYGDGSVSDGSASTPSTVERVYLNHYSASQPGQQPRLALSIQGPGGKAGVLLLDYQNADLGPKRYIEVPGLDSTHRLAGVRMTESQIEFLLRGASGQIGIFQTQINHDGLLNSFGWAQPVFLNQAEGMVQLRARSFVDGSPSWVWVGVRENQVYLGRIRTGTVVGDIQIDSTFGQGGLVSVYSPRGSVLVSDPAVSVGGILLGVSDSALQDSFGQGLVFRLNSQGQFPSSNSWPQGKAPASLPNAFLGNVAWVGSRILATGRESAYEGSKAELYLSEVIGN